MIRLYIEGQEIELDKTVQFAITKQFEELSNPTTIINDWSKTVSIPFTVKNHNIFGHIYNPDKTIVQSNNTFTGIYFDPLRKLDFRLEWDSAILMTGYAKMNEIKQKDSTGTYEITLFGQLGKVFQEMKKITFDTTTEDTDYLIDGSLYVDENINKTLISTSWAHSGQSDDVLRKKTDSGYNVHDIIGFAPNNSYSEEFDYKTFQHINSTTNEDEALHFTDVLGDTFTEITGISPDTAIPNGMLPREIGEYRSYYQLPFIYFTKLFKIFQEKAEAITGYTFELNQDWFNTNNPYWYKLVYMLKPFSMAKQDGGTNYYNAQLSYNCTWTGNTSTTRQDRNLILPEITENFHFVKEFGVNPTIMEVSKNFSVNINYNLGFELLDKGSSDPYSLRIHKDNAISLSLWLCKSDGTAIKQEKFLICDNEYTGSTSGYKTQNILKYGELIRTGTYPNRKRYITINPYVNFYLTNYQADEYKIIIGANWVSSTYRFMTKYTSSDSYVGVIPETVLQSTDNSLLSALASYAKRSNNYFTLNDLWNNDFNLFNEIINYCKMYRISIDVDDNNKKIIFKPYSVYFRDYSIVDWTNKIDKSKDFIITPITFENKYVLFNYEDSKTQAATEYKERYGVNYGEYKLVTDYNFNNNTTNLFNKIKSPIVNTDNVLSWTNLDGFHTVQYSFPSEIFVYNKNKDKKQEDIFGTMFFHNGLANFSTESLMRLRPVKISDDTKYQQSNNTYFYTQGAESMDSVTTYPKLDVLNGSNMCVFNIPKENFTYNNNYSGKNTIYTNLWQSYLDERYNVQNKKITCYVTLKPSDFSNFVWNKFVKVGNQIYIVNKIYDYDITASTSTKVDLITINNINAYTDSSFLESIDTLTLHFLSTSYISGNTTSSPSELGYFETGSAVTFSNGSTTYTYKGVNFTISGNKVYYQCVSKYVDEADADFNVTLKNSHYTGSFHCVRYSTYPYPYVMLYETDGTTERDNIQRGERTYKVSWYGTETEGISNVPTVSFDYINTSGTAYIDDSTWTEQQVMIAGEGGAEYFRTEYQATLHTNVYYNSDSKLKIIITDVEGWHNSKEYPIIF